MKKLAMVLALAFTMGLAASTVNASTGKDEKPKKECTADEKKACSSDKKACCASDKKACCSKDKKAEAPATEKKTK